VRVGLDDGADVGRQLRVPLFAALAAARGEVLQAADAVMPLVPSLLDRLASPTEASFGLAGAAAAQLHGDLGLEQAALVSRKAPGPRPNQGIVLRDGVVHHDGPARGETVTDRPRNARHSGGQDSSVRGRFPSAGRLRKLIRRRSCTTGRAAANPASVAATNAIASSRVNFRWGTLTMTP